MEQGNDVRIMAASAEIYACWSDDLPSEIPDYLDEKRRLQDGLAQWNSRIEVRGISELVGQPTL